MNSSAFCKSLKARKSDLCSWPSRKPWGMYSRFLSNCLLSNSPRIWALLFFVFSSSEYSDGSRDGTIDFLRGNGLTKGKALGLFRKRLISAYPKLFCRSHSLLPIMLLILLPCWELGVMIGLKILAYAKLNLLFPLLASDFGDFVGGLFL
jgi:hypothetical protein